ncbi:MAG TPA: hypothetical protein GX525_04595, partial [Bacilli bacterium]|nr:hypothetical protein [Bacilli bacterium]
MNNRNPVLAFFLSFIPGVGFLYMDRIFRGTMYLLSFFSMFLGSVFLVFIAHEPEPALIAAFIGAMIFFIQMVDMVVFLFKREKRVPQEVVINANGEESQPVPASPMSSDQLSTLLLAFIPGLGHFHLGLMNRGLTFLLSFFGSIMMVLFITYLTAQGGFLIFLGIVAVIWIFNLFDIVQLLKRKGEGEVLEDRTVLEDLEKHRESGKKSRAFALLLGIFPGAGHMYLGLQKRGLQLMAGFLFAIYFID